jgi:hypothetical protein
MPSAVNTSSNNAVNLLSWVSDQESEVAAEYQVTGLLGHPTGRRVRRDSQYVDAARGVLDHHEALQSCERDRLHAEEVAGKVPDAWPLRNCLRVRPMHCGAGSNPAFFKIA